MPFIEPWLPIIACIVVFTVLAAQFLKVFTSRLDKSMESGNEEVVKSVRAMVRFGYVSILALTAFAILPFLLPEFPPIFPNKHAPMQILKACQLDTDKAAETCSPGDTQWFLNIGGDVETQEVDDAKPREWKELLTSAFAEARTKTDQVIRNEPALSDDLKNTLAESTARTLKGVQDQHEAQITFDSPILVANGLVVPLYVIIIALFGGCIGMTRRLPELQKRGAPGYISYYKRRKDIDPTLKLPLDAVCVREHVVFQIMQAVFAPFLAVVAYALIDPTDTPGIVAIAFISGFASESILVQIRKVADATSSLSTGDQAQNVRVVTPNPKPRADELDPKTTTVGNTNRSVTVIGADFVEMAEVRVGGDARPTTFETAEKLVFELDAADDSAAGDVTITVFNPTPGGGESNPLTLTVT